MFAFIRLALLISAFSLAPACFAQDWDLPTVLDRLIHTYGGESNLRKVDNMVQEWDFVALMGGTHGIDTRSVRAPLRLRVELRYPHKSETRILDGDAAYYAASGAAPQAATSMQADAMRLQLMRLYSPLTLRGKIDSMGLLEQDGLLALSLAENGVHAHYMVNTDTWRIEKVAGVLNLDGHEIQFLTEYSDFAVLDGVLVHRAENKFANGVNTAQLKLRRITFDAPLDDSLFKP